MDTQLDANSQQLALLVPWGARLSSPGNCSRDVSASAPWQLCRPTALAQFALLQNNSEPASNASAAAFSFLFASADPPPLSAAAEKELIELFEDAMFVAARCSMGWSRGCARDTVQLYRVRKRKEKMFLSLINLLLLLGGPHLRAWESGPGLVACLCTSAGGAHGRLLDPVSVGPRSSRPALSPSVAQVKTVVRMFLFFFFAFFAMSRAAARVLWLVGARQYCSGPALGANETAWCLAAVAAQSEQQLAAMRSALLSSAALGGVFVSSRAFVWCRSFLKSRIMQYMDRALAVPGLVLAILALLLAAATLVLLGLRRALLSSWL